MHCLFFTFQVREQFLFSANLSDSNVSSLKVPEIFDDDSIKNEQASMEISLSHDKSMGHFSDTQGQPKFELIQEFINVFVTCKFKKESDW